MADNNNNNYNNKEQRQQNAHQHSVHAIQTWIAVNKDFQTIEPSLGQNGARVPHIPCPTAH